MEPAFAPAAGPPPLMPAAQPSPWARRALLVALALSAAIHVAVSFFPAEIPSLTDEAPLRAVLTEMPPPPKPVTAPTPKVRPRPKRVTAPPAPSMQPEPPPALAADETPPPLVEPTADAIAMGPEAPDEIVAPQPQEATPPPKTLPRRVDLVYKAFLGSDGMLIGQAVYRFEHDSNEYRIFTVAEAKGLAAIFLRGQGKLESRGVITADGLQPREFSVERGSRERREVATFDWETGMVTLHEQKTEALELPTYDPLALMWQPYFTPPIDDAQEINIATTRRVGHYTITREAEETISWSQGDIVTERWHRRSDDGKSDAYVWVAPSLRYVPVRMRLRTKYGGFLEATLEATLDSIRVDETLARQ